MCSLLVNCLIKRNLDLWKSLYIYLCLCVCLFFSFNVCVYTCVLVYVYLSFCICLCVFVFDSLCILECNHSVCGVMLTFSPGMGSTLPNPLPHCSTHCSTHYSTAPMPRGASPHSIPFPIIITFIFAIIIVLAINILLAISIITSARSAFVSLVLRPRPYKYIFFVQLFVCHIIQPY